MSNRLSVLIKKKLFTKGRNLMSVEEPFSLMPKLLKSCKVGGIIDAGASNGRISRRFLRWFPHAKVYAFEPNPAYFDDLNEYAKSDPRFCPQFLALSDCKGSFGLNITSSRGSTSLLKPAKCLQEIDPNGSVVKKTETVEVTTIDDWIKENGNPSIELMKFDIQGNELKALKGARRTIQESVLLIYTEVCFKPLYDEGAIFSHIDLFLREYGFELYDFYGLKYSPNGVLLWANAIFIHTQRIEKAKE